MTVFNDGENPTYPERNSISTIRDRDSSSLFAHKTVCHLRHLQLPLIESRSSLGNWLWVHRFGNLRACFKGGKVGECTSTSPCPCCRRIAICRKCEVCEWCKCVDLQGTKSRDGLTLNRDRCSTDKRDREERKERRQPDHMLWNTNRECTSSQMILYGCQRLCTKTKTAQTASRVQTARILLFP